MFKFLSRGTSGWQFIHHPCTLTLRLVRDKYWGLQYTQSDTVQHSWQWTFQTFRVTSMGAIESCDDRELYDAPLVRSAVLVLLNFDWFMKSTTCQSFLSLLVIGSYFSWNSESSWMNHFLRLTDEGATTPKPVLDWSRLYKLSYDCMCTS